MFVCLGLCEKPHYVSDPSKLEALLHKTDTKVFLVLRYQGSTCVDSYYHEVKQHINCGMITHSAKETGQQKEQWGWGLEVTRKCEGKGWKKLEKGGVVGNVGGDLHKIVGLAPLPTT